MSYVLASTSIKPPKNINEANSTQFAVQRVLTGAIGRQYFGSNKRVWTLNYENTNKNDYDIIRAIYNDYLNTGNLKSWQVTETNYSISATYVHVDLTGRDFKVGGTDYISDFTLTLTEA
jgi:hypothetical protein